MENEIKQEVQTTEAEVSENEAPVLQVEEKAEAKDGSPKPKKKNIKVIIIIIAAIIVIAGGIFAYLQLTKECEHEWKAATVFAPKTCNLCGETEGEALIAIPDIKNLDEVTAKSLLAGKGFIPKIEYEYDDDIEEGQVIKTKPSIGSGAVADDVVTVYISKGPYSYYLNNSLAVLNDIKGVEPFEYPKTKWHDAPYVEEGYLYIPINLGCKSKYKLSFYAPYGEAFGSASINDSFDKTVPIEIITDNIKIDNKGEITKFILKIPLSDLDVQKPTNIYTKTSITVNGERDTFDADFDLSW